VLVEYDCGETLTLTASRTTCGRCGEVHTAIIEEVLDTRPEDKVDYPWRSLNPFSRVGSLYVSSEAARRFAEEA
jgi:hypothetical protein